MPRFTRLTSGRMRVAYYAILLVTLLLLQNVTVVFGQSPAQDSSSSFTGTFYITVGDYLVNGKLQTEMSYSLYDTAGTKYALDLNPALADTSGGVLALNGKQVNVTTKMPAAGAANGGSNSLTVTAIELTQPAAKRGAGTLPPVAPATTGSFPYLIIPCVYSGGTPGPRDQSYFQGLFSNTAPGFDNWIREMSYNDVNLQGSQAVNWVTVGKTLAQYIPAGKNQVDTDALRDDCLAAARAANPSLNATTFKGIAIMMNDAFANASANPFAQGTLGPGLVTIDGKDYQIQTTWVPYFPTNPADPQYPTGFSWLTHGLISHEVGHNFKSPHTGDIKGQEYDDPWDVESKDDFNCGVTPSAWRNATYGCVGQHIAGINKELMGFIPTGRVVDFSFASGSQTYTLDRLAQPTGNNPLVIRIPHPTNGNKYFTVEARQQVGYDVKLPGNGVVIFDTDRTRTQGSNPNAPFGYLNAPNDDVTKAWDVGSTYTNTDAKIQIQVVSSTASTYTVKVTSTLPVTSNVTLLPATVRLASAFGGNGTPLTATGATPKLGDTSTVTITAGGTNGIPANATGIFGVLTNVGCTGGGNLRFWTGSTVPNSVNLNIPGANSALNLSTSFTAALDTSGKVNLGLGSAAGNSCGYAVDVSGYIVAPTNGGMNLLPGTVRLATASGSNGTVLTATGATPQIGDTSTVTITAVGANGIPSGATGIFGVLTNIGCTGGGNLRLWAGSTVPNSVNLNIPGANSALNLSTSFTAPLDSSGKFELGLGSAAGNSCGYALDVIGYITGPTSGTGGVKLLPASVRAASAFGGNGTPLTATGATPTAGDSSTVAVQATGTTTNIPTNAEAVIGVLTNVGCTGGGNLRFWNGSTVPNSVNLNIPGANPALNLSTGFIASIDNTGKVNLGLGSAAGKSCGYAVDIIGYIAVS